jgi:hypothetical protein
MCALNTDYTYVFKYTLVSKGQSPRGNRDIVVQGLLSRAGKKRNSIIFREADSAHGKYGNRLSQSKEDKKVLFKTVSNFSLFYLLSFR